MKAPFAVSACMGMAIAVLLAAPARAVEAERAMFGALRDGTRVEAVTLTNAHGVSARIVAWGAMLQSLITPDRHGRRADIVLSYPDMEGYEDKPQFFGATVGRYANRIAAGTFTIDGRRYKLAKNDGDNSLHGGTHGFDKQLWKIGDVTRGKAASVTLTRISPDGEEGYPGELNASITYALDEHDTLTTTFIATTTKPTVISLTNHSLFNLAGAASGRSILEQRLKLEADAFTPVDAGLIPTGEIRAVAGTPFDFRLAHRIGERIADGSDVQMVRGRGYDHNFVLNGPAGGAPRLAARLEDPASGRVMELLTTQPGLQVYSGNFLDATVVGVDHTIYRQGSGLALEPQHFPNSPNQPGFPSPRLDPGQTYRQVTVYRFLTSPH